MVHEGENQKQSDKISKGEDVTKYDKAHENVVKKYVGIGHNENTYINSDEDEQPNVLTGDNNGNTNVKYEQTQDCQKFSDVKVQDIVIEDERIDINDHTNDGQERTLNQVNHGVSANVYQEERDDLYCTGDKHATKCHTLIKDGNVKESDEMNVEESVKKHITGKGFDDNGHTNADDCGNGKGSREDNAMVVEICGFIADAYPCPTVSPIYHAGNNFTEDKEVLVENLEVSSRDGIYPPPGIELSSSERVTNILFLVSNHICVFWDLSGECSLDPLTNDHKTYNDSLLPSLYTTPSPEMKSTLVFSYSGLRCSKDASGDHDSRETDIGAPNNTLLANTRRSKSLLILGYGSTHEEKGKLCPICLVASIAKDSEHGCNYYAPFSRGMGVIKEIFSQFHCVMVTLSDKCYIVLAHIHCPDDRTTGGTNRCTTLIGT